MYRLHIAELLCGVDGLFLNVYLSLSFVLLFSPLFGSEYTSLYEYCSVRVT